MADESFSVWGAEEADILAGPSTRTGAQAPKKPAAPKLFDDLGDADWGSPDTSQQQLQQQQQDTLTQTHQKEEDLLEQAGPSLTGETEDAFFGGEDERPGWAGTANDDEGGGQQGQSVTAFDDSAGFDDFKDGQDDFGGGVGDGDDDFGDFGEADDEPHTGDFGAIEEEQRGNAYAQGSGAPWRPLETSPNSNMASLSKDVRDILSLPMADGRLYPFHDGAASRLTQDNVRQVEGPAQVLVREESRQVWSAVSGQPNLKPVDWMRSKTRRQFLIAMGVPINLDELNTSSTEGKSLPPLAVKLEKNGASTPLEESRSSAVGGKQSKSREGSRPPEMDMDRAKDILALSEDQLTLLSLPALRDLSREVDLLTRQASAVLTHYLAQREAHTADAETYNGLIRDLVTGAAKRVSANNAGGSGSVGGKASRHASIRREGPPGSGRSSPAVGGGAGRSGSPRV